MVRGDSKRTTNGTRWEKVWEELDSSSSTYITTLISKMSSTSTNSRKVTPGNMFGFNSRSWQYWKNVTLVACSQE